MKTQKLIAIYLELDMVGKATVLGTVTSLVSLIIALVFSADKPANNQNVLSSPVITNVTNASQTSISNISTANNAITIHNNNSTINSINNKSNDSPETAKPGLQEPFLPTIENKANPNPSIDLGSSKFLIRDINNRDISGGFSEGATLQPQDNTSLNPISPPSFSTKEPAQNLTSISSIVRSGDFFETLVKGVAEALIIDGLKSAYASPQTPQPDPKNLTGVPPTDNIRDQVQDILLRLYDQSQPLSSKLSLYADQVDFYKKGVVGKEYIRNDALTYMRKFPSRSYNLTNISKIEVDKSGMLAATHYTLGYEVSNESKTIRGTADYAILIGNLDSQPKIYVIKEWITSIKYD